LPSERTSLGMPAAPSSLSTRHLTRVHDGESLEDLKPWRVRPKLLFLVYLWTVQSAPVSSCTSHIAPACSCRPGCHNSVSSHSVFPIPRLVALNCSPRMTFTGHSRKYPVAGRTYSFQSATRPLCPK